ncbi:MAG: GumC family protein [Patescibacteria group bacterium]
MELDLLDYARIIWRRKWLIAALVIVAGAASYAASKLSPKVYEAKSKILVLDKQGASMSILNEIGGMPKNQVSNYVEILRSRSLARAVLRRLGKPADARSLEQLDDSLTIQPVQGTDTIEIRVQSTDPVMAQRLANTYVQCFMARSLLDNQADARSARVFIEDQLAIVSARLDRAETSLAAYQRSAKIVSPTDEVREVIEKLANLEAAAASLDVSLAQDRARLAKVEEQLTTVERSIISAVTSARNPVHEHLRERLSALQAELAAALAKYTEKHPQVIALKAEIAKVQEELARELETIVTSRTESLNPLHQADLQQAAALRASIVANEAGRAALAGEIAAFEAELAALPDKEMRLARLVRDKASAEAIYNLLVTKKSEMEITEHMRTADVRLVDPAYRPRQAIKPRTRLNVAVAVFLGLFVGAGLALLLEYLDPSIRTRDEAVAVLGLPVFGMIPDDEVFAENRKRRRRHGRSQKIALRGLGQ